MSHQITLRLQEQASVLESDGAQGYRMRIVAVDAENMPNEIFLFNTGIIDISNALTDATFMGVCSSADLSFFPANEANLEISPPYFRKSVVDIIVPSKATAGKVWQGIQERVQVLLDQLNRQDILVETDEVTFT